MQGDVGHDRKNVGMLIKTFVEVFKNKKDAPALLLKMSAATFSRIDQEEMITKIQKVLEQYKYDEIPSIYLIHGDLTQSEMNELYNHPKIKAHISFTKGEGFGRPLLEASISGKPVIASNWSGQTDFLDSDLSCLLSGELENVHKSAANKFLIEDSKWFKVNYSLAAQTMNSVFHEYPKFKLSADKQSKKNQKKFTLNHADKSFLKIWDKYVPEFETKIDIKLPKLKKSASGLPTLKKKT